MNILFPESGVDYKYDCIYKEIPDLQVREVSFFSFIKFVIRNHNTDKIFYHIRYLRWQGYIVTILRYIFIVLLSRIFRFKIIWSVHNIIEHNYPSGIYNELIKKLLFKVSYKLVVFNRSLLNFLPEYVECRVVVANFGSFKEKIELETIENKEFYSLYKNWLNKENKIFPDIVSISTAKRNNLNYLEDLSVKRPEISNMIIAPGVKLSLTKCGNLFRYSDGFVNKEVREILNCSVIGFVAHNNHSVPTSIYMYASYNIPIIGFDIEPIRNIIIENGIGEVFATIEELEVAYERIKDNYEVYATNCKTFLERNSWADSGKAHGFLIE